VWAIRVVEAGVANQEVIQDLAVQQGGLHDPRDVGERDVSVPDALRVDHDDRSVLALIETSRCVGSCEVLEADPFELSLEGVPQVLGAHCGTRTSGVSGRSAVATNEEVLRVGRHGGSGLGVRCLKWKRTILLVSLILIMSMGVVM
jgi:hypothetical protein